MEIFRAGLIYYECDRIFEEKWRALEAIENEFVAVTVIDENFENFRNYQCERCIVCTVIAWKLRLCYSSDESSIIAADTRHPSTDPLIIPWAEMVWNRSTQSYDEQQEEHRNY